MNKVIWITGASSGIGKALALKFAEEGWQVAASARREDLLNEMSSLNKNISSFPLDLAILLFPLSINCHNSTFDCFLWKVLPFISSVTDRLRIYECVSFFFLLNKGLSSHVWLNSNSTLISILFSLVDI